MLWLLIVPEKQYFEHILRSKNTLENEFPTRPLANSPLRDTWNTLPLYIDTLIQLNQSSPYKTYNNPKQLDKTQKNNHFNQNKMSTLQPPNPAPDTNEDIELGLVHVSLPPTTSPSPPLPQATSQQHAPQQHAPPQQTITLPAADTDSEPDGEVLALEEEIAERKATIERLKKRKEKRAAAKQRAAERRALRAQRDTENPTSSPRNDHSESDIDTSDSDDDEEENEEEARQRQQREQEYRLVRGAKYMGKKTLSGLEWAGSWVVWALGMDGDYADVLAAVDRMESDQKARQQEFPNN